MIDNGQIMGDEEIGQVHLLLKILQEIQDLRLDQTSREDVGSSRTMKSGSTANARAIPTLCCCPPRKLVRVAAIMVGEEAHTFHQVNDFVPRSERSDLVCLSLSALSML